MRPPTFVSGAEVLARIGMAAAIEAVEAAFAARHAGTIGAPVSVGIAVPEGSFHVKACAGRACAGGGLFVAKVNSNFPGNRSCDGLPTIQGVVAVFETASGRLRALVDSPSVTALRTAATTAVALRHLAPAGARVATVVGCGALGRFHLEALAACGFEQVKVFDRVAARAEDAARWARSDLGLDCTAVAEARPATLASPVVITCTTATVPFLGREDVRAGTLVAAVGADSDRKAEIAASLLAEARIVADSIDQCLKMGDLRNAAPGGPGVCGELADAVAGRLARTAGDEVVVFDSTGLALEDLAVCALLV
jgi:alanine dehydrogenase